jgi:hypothetical protein
MGYLGAQRKMVYEKSLKSKNLVALSLLFWINSLIFCIGLVHNFEEEDSRFGK